MTDNSLDSPGAVAPAGPENAEPASEGTGEDKKLLDEEKAGANNYEVSADPKTFEIIDVDEEIHLLD